MQKLRLRHCRNHRPRSPVCRCRRIHQRVVRAPAEAVAYVEPLSIRTALPAESARHSSPCPGVVSIASDPSRNRPRLSHLPSLKSEPTLLASDGEFLHEAVRRQRVPQDDRLPGRFASHSHSVPMVPSAEMVLKPVSVAQTNPPEARGTTQPASSAISRWVRAPVAGSPDTIAGARISTR